VILDRNVAVMQRQQAARRTNQLQSCRVCSLDRDQTSVDNMYGMAQLGVWPVLCDAFLLVRFWRLVAGCILHHLTSCYCCCWLV